ncbi:MAG: tetratricopeptide repeat protein, partial [Pseudomonadota bacterium]
LNAHYNRGNILSRLNRTEEAIFSYDNAIAIDANCVMAYNNRGLCFQKTGRLIKSMKDYDKATAIDPDFVMAYNNLGNVLKYLNRPHDAIVSYKKAIAINPGYIKAYYNLSLCQLLIGDFNDGWKGYEYRWKDDEVKNNVGIRNWPMSDW